MRLIRSALSFQVLALAGWLGLLSPLQADDIYNTFGPGLSYSASSRVIFDSTDVINGANEFTYGVLAQGFRAPAFATRLDRVSVPFLMDNPAASISPVTVSIFTGESFNDNGPPLGIVPDFLGQRVADLTQRSVLVGGVASEPTVFSYTSISPVTLDPNTFYWVVAQVTRQPASDARNEWFQSGFSHPFLLNYFWGGFPFGDPFDIDVDKYSSILEYSPDGLGLAMRIEASAVPEPTTISLITVSAVALAIRWRIRTSAKTRLL